MLFKKNHSCIIINLISFNDEITALKKEERKHMNFKEIVDVLNTLWTDHEYCHVYKIKSF